MTRKPIERLWIDKEGCREAVWRVDGDLFPELTEALRACHTPPNPFMGPAKKDKPKVARKSRAKKMPLDRIEELLKELSL